MKKRWEVFWLAEVGIILIYILLCLAAGRVLIAAGAAAAAVSAWRILCSLPPGRPRPRGGPAPAAVSVWWILYYFTAHYTLSNNVFEITSGIIFRRNRSIPLSNILWEMRLTSPFFRGSAMSVLHTSGGNAVVFCDFSTRTR